jgi:UDP-glucose 4-epimerase
MRVVVLGASGFLGSHTCDVLKRAGHQVVAVSRSPQNAGRLLGMGLNVLTYEELQANIEKYTSSHWIDFSWQGVLGKDRNSPDQFKNVERVRQIANLARASKAYVYIGVGSQAEYGPVGGAISESQHLNPTTEYGLAKVRAYETLRRSFFDSPTRLVWVRIFSTYGPGDSDEWLIPSLVKSLVLGSQIDLTPCEQEWDYLFVRDAAEAFLALVESNTAMGEFNLGSGAVTPLRDLVIQVANLVNPSHRIVFGGQKYREDQVMHLEADISKISEVTGWTPCTELRDGLRETVLDLRKG